MRSTNALPLPCNASCATAQGVLSWLMSRRPTVKSSLEDRDWNRDQSEPWWIFLQTMQTSSNLTKRSINCLASLARFFDNNESKSAWFSMAAFKASTSTMEAEFTNNYHRLIAYFCYSRLRQIINTNSNLITTQFVTFYRQKNTHINTKSRGHLVTNWCSIL